MLEILSANKINKIWRNDYVSINAQMRVPVKGQIDQMQLYFIDFNEIKPKVTKKYVEIKNLFDKPFCWIESQGRGKSGKNS